jgi:hypothetical protein
MQDFGLYFQLGWQHICNWEGYDHILFVTVLCGTYLIGRLAQGTGTGYCFYHRPLITLALSVLNVIHINSSLIEFLIPVTIVFTSLVNILKKRTNHQQPCGLTYAGLVFWADPWHGLLKLFKKFAGHQHQYHRQLFAFNIGLEFGQVLIVISALLISFLCIKFAKTPSAIGQCSCRRLYLELLLSCVSNAFY